MQFPPLPQQDDLAQQILYLISNILGFRGLESLVALFFTLLGLEKKFGILQKFISIVGKAKTNQVPSQAPEPAKTNGNGNGHTNGNGNGKEPIILALISSEKEYLLSKIESSDAKRREVDLQIRENLERMSLRITHVERDVSDIQKAFRDELAPLRTKLDAIQKYIEDQAA